MSVTADTPATKSSDAKLQDAIQYQGRKATRAKSEYRRRKILEAALQIAAREGIRGVKHRSVARQADVPLASTTYYFKDIDELIRDAFMLFVEKAQRNLTAFYDTLNRFLSQFDTEKLKQSDEFKQQVADGLVRLAGQYLNGQIRYRKQEILAEQVFLLEAIRDPDLKVVARNYRDAWVAGLEEVMKRVGSPSPETDAALLVTIVMGLGYDGILYDDSLSEQRLNEILRRVLYNVLRLPA